MQRFRSDKLNIRRPLVLMLPNYPVLSDWMRENIPGDVILNGDITIDMVQGREIYGWCDLPIMMAAAKVWWMFDRKQPLLRDIISPEYRWRYLTWRVLY